VTNDDGIDSEGLWHLAAAAAQAGLDVVVAAPATDASGSGSAMHIAAEDGLVEMLRRDLPAPAAGIPAYALKATPAFIVVLALRGAFGPAPQYVLSGINRGANTGKGVLSSGTLAAALVALPHGVPAAAFSLDIRDEAGEPEASAARPEWATAALVAGQVIPVLGGLPPEVALNVNVPDVPPDRLGAIRQTTLAQIGPAEMTMAPSADGYLKLSFPEHGRHAEPGSDFAVLSAGQVSVTPVRGMSDAPSLSLPWPATVQLR
jgi:5'-nucleotidase